MSVQSDVDDLLTLPTAAGRLARLRQQGLDDRPGLDWLLDRTEELLHDDPKIAADLAELVDAAAGELGSVRARARYQLARLRAESGELRTSLDLIADARALWHESGDQLAALRTDLGRMQVLDDFGRHDEAAQVGEQLIAAIDTMDQTADDPRAQRIRAHAVDNLGAALGFTGQHARALAAYEEAERAYRLLGRDDLAARPLANRAVELLAMGRPRESLTDLRTAIQGFLASGDRLFVAQCQGDMALAHQQLGELVESLALLEPARQTLQDLGAQAEADRLQLALTETYLALGLLPEARAAARATQVRTDRAGMVHDHARAAFNVALTYLAEGDAARAEAELAVAARGFREVADRQYLARTLLAQAEAAALRDHVDDATALAEQAAAAFDAGGWREALALAHLRLSDWAVELDVAQQHCDRAAVLVEELRLPELTHQWGLRTARIHRRRGRPAAAAEALRQAVADLDRATAALPDHTLRTAFRRDRLAAHDELADLLLEMGDIEGASAIADEAKARTLRDLMADTVGRGQDLTAGDRDLAAAHADLNATYVALHATTDGASLTELRRQAELLEHRVSELRLRGSHASTSGLGVVSPERLRTASPEHDAIAYHVLGEDVIIFVRRAGRTEAHRLPAVVPIVEQHLEDLSAQWLRFSLGRRFGPHQQQLMLSSTRETLARLYDVLVRPIQRVVDHHAELAARPGTAATALRIVPHRLIGSVPFQALFDGQRYLLERTAVVVVPTLAAPGSRDTRSWRRGPAVVVAAPDEAAPAVAAEGDLVAERLVRSADQGSAAPRSVQLLAGNDACADAVIAALPGAGLVHLACHAIYRADNPLYSRLRLSDRWLTSAEILELRLPGALVTLSACESGRHGHAAEPIGLGWAFLAAGAAGVVVSQWMVHDDSAGDLMVAYYDRLIAGDQPPEALRQAQLLAAHARPHPYFWAPFTFLESPGSVRPPPPRSSS